MLETTMDPVDLEILWSRLIGVTNEQSAALMRTSFTSVVRESGDLSAAVFDSQGRMLAQAVTGTPGHINSLATSMKHFLAEYPPNTLRSGDVLITNDPWKTSGQLNDFSVVTPAFFEGSLIGFFGNTCHAVDIGGRGLSADAHEVFEEGLWVPICKLFEQGRPNQDLLRLIAANVRVPDEVIGDLHAQVAANQVGVDRLLAYLAEFKLPNLDELAREILARSERAMREAISQLPDGDYEKTIQTDGLDDPVTIHCCVQVRGDKITVDYAGSSAQVDRGLNVVLNYTAAYTNYALKCAICPIVPHNDGSFQPVTVRAPQGSILNPTFPAAVAARHIVGHFLPHAVFGALAKVIPDRIIAEGAGNIWLITVRGLGNQRFVSVVFAAGGMGARPHKDGLSTTSFPSGIAGMSVEMIESTSPLVIRRKELRTDSGGPGRYRGGLGQTIEIGVRTGEPYVVAALADRFRFPAQGYAGGGPGGLGGFRSGRRRLKPKLSITLPAEAAFTLDLPGGGGFYDASSRARSAVAEDLADGLVSPGAALRDYGSHGTHRGGSKPAAASRQQSRMGE